MKKDMGTWKIGSGQLDVDNWIWIMGSGLLSPGTGDMDLSCVRLTLESLPISSLTCVRQTLESLPISSVPISSVPISSLFPYYRLQRPGPWLILIYVDWINFGTCQKMVLVRILVSSRSSIELSNTNIVWTLPLFIPDG